VVCGSCGGMGWNPRVRGEECETGIVACEIYGGEGSVTHVSEARHGAPGLVVGWELWVSFRFGLCGFFGWRSIRTRSLLFRSCLRRGGGSWTRAIVRGVLLGPVALGFGAYSGASRRSFRS